jgi:DNA-binding transcriptional LysR family regulator
MDDVGKLVLFRDVVALQSFSAAAKRRGLTHSTVSKHVRSLEEALGVKLLHRTSRSMSLTEEGRLVFETSKSVGQSVARLQRQLEALRGEVRGEIRVQSLIHLGRTLVEPAIAELLRSHPHVTVTLVLDDGPLHFNREGFDLAVRVGMDVEGTLSARRLADNDVCLVASPDYVDRHGLPEHPSDLGAWPTVAYQAGTVAITAWRYEDEGEIRVVEVDSAYRVNNGNALLAAARAGLGIGYVSAFAAHDDLQRGALVRVLPGFALPSYEPVYLIDGVIDGGPEHRPPRVEALRQALFARAATLAR